MKAGAARASVSKDVVAVRNGRRGVAVEGVGVVSRRRSAGNVHGIEVVITDRGRRGKIEYAEDRSIRRSAPASGTNHVVGERSVGNRLRLHAGDHVYASAGAGTGTVEVIDLVPVDHCADRSS